ncbi:MAG: radical SAM family heme chaperone HemW [Thermodesulfovibrionia bacterium]|nr:radical SAM family heme chaperone HemW [Thermodesulfovibrionia bacterium]
MPASLYVHIPFCLKRCIYCDFVSGIYDPQKAAAYIKALKKEILAIPRGTSFSTIYIGGGTPTALPTEFLKDLIGHIFTRFDFSPPHPPLIKVGQRGGEATIEANPGTLDLEKLRDVKEAGMNRLSIGVQSFNDDELKLLHRLHSSSEAERAFYLAREAGFQNIGIDLIYGIPGQSIESWKKTLQKAVQLGPEHISAYELTVENGTLLHERIKEGGISVSDEELIIEMYNHTIDHLSLSGYEHYEISNFAKPGCRSRHNLNYWDRGDYYAAGLGAHSFINGNRSYNIGDLEDYLKAISDNRSPVQEEVYITKEKAASEAIFLGLRTTDGINVESFFKRYGMNILSHYQAELADMQANGLIEITNSECSYETNLRLTRRGLLLSNEVFVRLS